MKRVIKTMKRKNCEIAFKKNWNSVCQTIEDNLAMVLLVLHDEYGFGRERIGKILDSMTDMAKRFDEYHADEVLEYKRKELTGGFLDTDDLHEFLKVRLKGVIPEEYYDEIFCKPAPSNYEMRAKYKRNTADMKPGISLSEAAEIQSKMLAMRDFCSQKGLMAIGKEVLK